MMHEQERIEIKHTGGVGAFFYGLIPGSIGGAALLWLAFVSGCLDLQQQRTFANRMDNHVGVVKPLDTPVTLTVEQRGCMAIQRAFIDADTVVAYVKNGCDSNQNPYWEWQDRTHGRLDAARWP